MQHTIPTTLLVLELVSGGAAACSQVSTGASGPETSTDTSTDTGGPSLDPSLGLVDAEVRYDSASDALVFELSVEGDAGAYLPEAAGQLDGAPVVGYVFLTTLSPSAVGFGDVVGTLALAVTSHPDFDDTPLWDEDGNATYDDDGVVYHAHWVVLGDDARAPAGLAVIQSDDASTLPPTAPMAMYLDSPGFTVIEEGHSLRVVVPMDRVGRALDFEVGVLTAMMRVDASTGSPLLAVESVESALDEGATTLSVQGSASAPDSAWPAAGASDNSFDISETSASFDTGLDTWRLTMQVEGIAATEVPVPVGAVDGAPVVGYVFPTTIAPVTVGFQDTDGTLALAVTSHPDFDDTPFWDENQNTNYADDGAVYHVHWVVLSDDASSTAGLSVLGQSDPSKLPPTAPMPMYLDSPGFHAFAQGDELHVMMPAWRLPGVSQFNFDAVTARMQVDASAETPVLRVQEVVEVLSGDLSLPFEATK